MKLIFEFLFKDEILQAGQQGEELLMEIRKKTEMCVDRIGNISSIERSVITLKSFSSLSRMKFSFACS